MNHRFGDSDPRLRERWRMVPSSTRQISRPGVEEEGAHAAAHAVLLGDATSWARTTATGLRPPHHRFFRLHHPLRV